MKKAAVAQQPPRATVMLLSRVLWLLFAALWVLVAAAMLTFSPLDPPSHAITPPRTDIANVVGTVGAIVSYSLFTVIGPGAWVALLAALAALVITVRGATMTQPIVRTLGVMMVAVAASSFTALYFPRAGAMPEGTGGLVGIALAEALHGRFGVFGATVWLSLATVIGVVVVLDSWLEHVVRLALAGLGVAARTGATAARHSGPRITAWPRRAGARLRARDNDVDDDARPEAILDPNAPRDDDESGGAIAPSNAKRDPSSGHNGLTQDDEEEDTPGAPQVFDAAHLRSRIAKLPVRFAASGRASATEQDLADWRSTEEAELAGYKFPSLDLLENPETNYSERMERFIREQARVLEETLRTYRINGQVVGAESGPVITLFEMRLAPGTKVSQVTSVSQDIARSLKAVNVRIVPSMIGRDTVGVEVPNASREKVRLKELMASPKGKVASEEMKLPMFLGKDVGGAPLIEDLAAMPHLLIAGATGSGKSVCMNSVIMSFLYTRKPNELKLVLIDPKMVEMSQFRDIPHLMCPVITEMSKAAAILEWAVSKMDERYSLLADAGVRDMNSYNKLGWEELKERLEPATPEDEARIPRRLPYIVFVIDELADLIMTHKEVEGFIVRVAQKARAVGIHLVIATQRPQANVVTGLIKSNMPGRICFKVASGMDSRIVLDQKGGELLLGQGDMLFLSSRSHKLARAQGALVEDHEARKVVRYLRDVAAPSFERQLVQIRPGGVDAERDGLEAAQEDPLFDKAVEIVLETKRGSVSLLQRRLAIGYTRASRLVDLMGEAGIIGSYKGTVAREVLISRAEWEAMKAQAEADANAPDRASDSDDSALGGGAQLAQDDEAALQGTEDAGYLTGVDEPSGASVASTGEVAGTPDEAAKETPTMIAASVVETAENAQSIVTPKAFDQDERSAGTLGESAAERRADEDGFDDADVSMESDDEWDEDDSDVDDEEEDEEWEDEDEDEEWDEEEDDDSDVDPDEDGDELEEDEEDEDYFDEDDDEEDEEDEEEEDGDKGDR